MMKASLGISEAKSPLEENKTPIDEKGHAKSQFSVKKSVSPLRETIDKIMQMQNQSNREIKKPMNLRKPINSVDSFSKNQFFQVGGVTGTREPNYFVSKSSSLVFDENDRIDSQRVEATKKEMNKLSPFIKNFTRHIMLSRASAIVLSVAGSCRAFAECAYLAKKMR